jgi:hypothetical protein
MVYDQDKVDEITLALLWLTSFKIRVLFEHEGARLGYDGTTSHKGLHL